MADQRVKPTFEAINDKRAALQRCYIVLDNQTRVLAALDAALHALDWQTDAAKRAELLTREVARAIVANCERIVLLADELDGREGSGSASQG